MRARDAEVALAFLAEQGMVEVASDIITVPARFRPPERKDSVRARVDRTPGNAEARFAAGRCHGRGCPSRWRAAGGRGTKPLHATSMFYPSDEDRDAVTAPPVPGLG
jgi:hypothetical protein